MEFEQAVDEDEVDGAALPEVPAPVLAEDDAAVLPPPVGESELEVALPPPVDEELPPPPPPAAPRQFGCSTCRWAVGGCQTCRKPGYKPRGPNSRTLRRPAAAGGSH